MNTTTIDAAGTIVADPLQETARQPLAHVEQRHAVMQQAQPASGTASLMRLIEAAAARPDMDLTKINGLIDVYERWQKREAENAYNAAFAAFKSEGVQVIRNRTVNDGPLKGRTYADGHAWVIGVSEAMSRHGMSFSWQIVEDSKEWIRVECKLRHVQGHYEVVGFGGPPDTGGAKNAMHARSSTVSYLERYTLKAATGLSEQDDDADDDGGPPPAPRPPPSQRERTAPPPQAAQPEYTDEEFAEKLPPWVDQLTIPNEKSGKCIAPERLIAFIESKGKRFTQAQKDKLTSYKPPF
jgi:hypothetical protein